ncbi:hypothetical protein GBAR_LOCUS3844 [Geodia barretti]|uniref:SAM domain-containing protein n=1 Tax=Geodia barretti TaxID=519541 RepID=A0AA35W7G8_GEOBA|nr:hypothetical protein GBAR_LOCUS3844 [Geodia barretti]
MSELPGGAGGRGKGSEYSSRSSYSEGDLEVRRQQVQGEEREREREERESLEQLDTFLNDLKDMTDGLESVLQPKKEEKRRRKEQATPHSNTGDLRERLVECLFLSPPLHRRQRSCEEKRLQPSLSMDGSQELSDETKLQNRTYLKSLDSLQILKMLATMGLGQYQEVFGSQQINGDLLLECDDKMLQNDLQVSSKLHRIRLLRIISGNYSVLDILSGRDGYVTMHPCK